MVGSGSYANVGATTLVLVIALGATSRPAQAASPAAPAEGSAPQIVSGALRQLGDDLRWRLRFSRPVRAAELDRARGRFVCVVLDPAIPRSRRRVCVGYGTGRLRVTISAIGADGEARGALLVVRRARAPS